MNVNHSENTTRLIRNGEALSLIIQLFHITISRITLRNWGKKYGFAKKISGRWYYDPKQMIEYITKELVGNTNDADGTFSKNPKNQEKYFGKKNTRRKTNG